MGDNGGEYGRSYWSAVLHSSSSTGTHLFVVSVYVQVKHPYRNERNEENCMFQRLGNECASTDRESTSDSITNPSVPTCMAISNACSFAHLPGSSWSPKCSSLLSPIHERRETDRERTRENFHEKATIISVSESKDRAFEKSRKKEAKSIYLNLALRNCLHCRFF